jgi:hypothetical protein
MPNRPYSSVSRLLAGKDTMHGTGSRETKAKVKQAQRYNPRQKPSPDTTVPPGIRHAYALAEQPVSGE